MRVGSLDIAGERALSIATSERPVEALTQTRISGGGVSSMRLTQRLTAQHGALLVVDLQDKLLAAIADRERGGRQRGPADPRRAGARDCRSGPPSSIREGLGPTHGRRRRADPGPAWPRRRFIAAPSPSSSNSSTAGTSAMSRSRGSRPTSAWPRRRSNCSTWGSGSRCRPTPWPRVTRSTGSSPCAGSSTPGPSFPPPRPSCSSGPRRADRPEFKAISELIKTMNRPAVH